MSDNQNQRSGDKSVNVQAGGDVTITNNAVILYSIEEVSKKLLNSAFGELPISTKSQIENNQKSYFDALSEMLHKIHKQSEEIKETIDSPDFQYISKKATISASRSSSKQLHESLASLIVNRINHDKEDLKRIVYNEAIETIEKLTQHQLKILTTCFILRRTKMEGLKDLSQFKQFFLDQKLSPFLDFKNTNAEFEHLVYTGCANISFIASDLSATLKQNYPDIFKNSDKPLEELSQDNKTAEKLKELIGNSRIMSMDLTSVGIVIASIYFEQITKDKLNIDIWIN